MKNHIRKCVQRVWTGSRSYITVLWNAAQYGLFEIYGRYEARFFLRTQGSYRREDL